jgi:hypothetical protein
MRVDPPGNVSAPWRNGAIAVLRYPKRGRSSSRGRPLQSPASEPMTWRNPSEELLAWPSA